MFQPPPRPVGSDLDQTRFARAGVRFGVWWEVCEINGLGPTRHQDTQDTRNRHSYMPARAGVRAHVEN